jgi:hypothetical protein
MESKQMKIRISLITREVEFEGDLQLIKENFGEYIEEYLKALKKDPPKNSQSKQTASSHEYASKSPGSNFDSSTIPDNFGEFYSRYPKSLSNVDKILLASYYIQNATDGKSFTVKDAEDILVEQGVSLSNAGVFNKSNISTKRVFKLSGKNFRISDIGVEYIKTLDKN